MGISVRVSATIVTAVMAIAVADVNAQPLNTPRAVGAPPPPTASPYLNLLRGGAAPGINNQALVRPQLYYQGAIQNLQAQAAAQTPMIQTPGQGSELPGTGIPVQFMNHRGYFLNAGAGFGGGGLTGTAGGMATMAGGARPAGGQVAAPTTGGRAPNIPGR